MFFLIAVSCSNKPVTVKQTMDNIVTRLHQSLDEVALSQLNDQAIMKLITAEDRAILATKYWTFDVNVPVIVSIMRHTDQKIPPFWLNSQAGFAKTDMSVENEEYRYEVWQKRFGAGRVELGINGFDKHRPHYFVCVAPENPGDRLELSNFYPANQFIGTMEIGAFTYHDWDELVLLKIPPALKGQKLLTTIRGRAREAHLINAFRKTPFPSSAAPDQVMLTWSENPATTQTIQWRTTTETNDGVVRFREKSSNSKAHDYEVKTQCHVLEDRLLQNDCTIHRYTAVLRDLKPATAYAYTVGSPEKNLWSEEAEFITAPDSTAPFSFVYLGDTHCSPRWGKLIDVAFERHPQTAFYTIAGDLVGTGLYRDEWDRFFTYSANVIQNRSVMPTLGNHDDQDGLGAWMYFDLFALPENAPPEVEPERVYSFEYANALFLILDVTSPIQKQVPWIEQQLSTTQATWKFAVFHFPPYMYRYEYRDIRQSWGTLFDRYHLDIAMSGHVHYYARSKPMADEKPVASPAEGTIYITSVSIPGGRENLPDEEFTEIHFGGGWLYQTIDIDHNRLTYRCYSFDGDIRDEFTIVK
ncbi:metallophosphoesterase family protein [candidate division KSB1 bacterium]|nr:metallophosphoesterase family protein [candidate division KSB1 bacterium]